LELIEAIIVKGDWMHSCGQYKKKEVIHTLQSMKEQENEQIQLLVDEIVSNYLMN
jgi:hypothetical protein